MSADGVNAIDVTADDTAAVIEYRYVTVAKAIARSITEAGLRPGQQLPSTDELAVAYDVSVHTARRAVKLLREHDAVVTLHGRGTFVGKHAAERIAELLHRQPQAEA